MCCVWLTYVLKISMWNIYNPKKREERAYWIQLIITNLLLLINFRFLQLCFVVLLSWQSVNSSEIESCVLICDDSTVLLMRLYYHCKIKWIKWTYRAWSLFCHWLFNLHYGLGQLMGKFSDFVGEANPSQGQFTFTVPRLVTMKKTLKIFYYIHKNMYPFSFSFFWKSNNFKQSMQSIIFIFFSD